MAISTPSHGPTVVRPEDAAAYLEKMDIRIADIVSAVEAGEIAAGNMTTFHPITAAGLTRWINVVGVLRENLAGRGVWVGRDPRNRPISRHTELGYSLSTLGGDEVTGVVEHPSGPRAARKRGIATAEAVNTGIQPLIRVETLRRTPTASDGVTPPPGSWFLLYHRSEGEVRLEVSLPLGFEDGQFTGWQVRVILDSWKPREPTQKPLDVGGQDVDFRVVEVG